MLPHMKDRPITMNRFPNGIQGETFYQKDAPDYFPDYVALQPVKKSSGGIVNYPLINNAAALVYLANYVCVPHVWLSKEPKLNYPDRMIFDFDPSPGVSFTTVKWAAKEVKAVLEDLGLPVFLMTTGSRGLHVVVPLKRKYLFDEIREFAQEIAHYLVEKYPSKLTLKLKKSERGRKIFVDTLRNAWGATAVAPYAVRAKEGAPIATPLKWSEISALTTPQKYTIKNIFQRISRIGDPWKDMNKKASAITQAQKKLGNL
jgi:bifunctional non-homologous end joining protein LigD